MLGLTISLILMSLMCGAQQATNAVLRIKLVDSNPNAIAMKSPDYPVPSCFIPSGKLGKTKSDSSDIKRGWLKDVYPGVDLVCYGDESHVEYVFVVPLGADPSLIRLACEGPRKITLDHSGKIVLDMVNSEVDQGPAVVFLQSGTSSRKIDGVYNIDENSVVDITPGGEFDEQVSNNQFLQFLNNAQANPGSPLGVNTFFDKDGNVWLNAGMKENGRMFNIAASRLAYDGEQANGSRYFFKGGAKGRAHFGGKPVAGVSWLGAMKYCNWQTIQKGYDTQKRSYTEGPNIADWTPAPATNWSMGFFKVVSPDASKGFQFTTPYPPSGAFAIHILYSFYSEAASAQLTANEPGPVSGGTEEGTPDEQPAEVVVTKGSGSQFSLNVTVPPTRTDQIAPNGVAYQEQPGAQGGSAASPETPVSNAGGGGGGEGASVVIPPPQPPTGPVYHTLTVASENPAAGVHIDVAPSDIHGTAGNSAPFKRVYVSGSIVTITAPSVSTAHTIFEGWQSSVAAYNTTNPAITVKMSGDVSVTAVYMAPVQLTVESYSPIVGVPIQASMPDIFSGLANGSTPFHLDYFPGTTVTLTAPPSASGGAFLRWLENGAIYSLSATTTVTLVSDTTMSAVYFTHTLHIRASGGVGVPIAVSPVDVTGNSGGTTPFDRGYPDGATVTLTAPQIAANGNVFQEWQKDGVNYSTNLTTSIFMNLDYTMMAVYLYVPAPIPNPTVSPSGL
jgi:hypothetical protein